MQIERCYFCGSVKTSTEHVPPRCLFPEKKDSGGIDYRKNLVTVPSCDKHNTQYSKDDEFLMVCLAGMIGNNSVGYEHQKNKVDRALKRRSYKLLKTALKNKKDIIIKSDNKFIHLIKSNPDIDRLHSIFEKIGYGIYFDYFKTQFTGRIKIFPAFFFSDKTNKNYNTFKQLIKDAADNDLADKPTIGDNPDVFYYQFADVDNFGVYGLRTRYYGGIDVYYSFIPNAINSETNFTQLSIDEGWRTIIHTNKRTYEFN